MAITTVINTLLYFIFIVTAFLGNVLVLCAVKRNRHMHTTTNFLLANLAAADLWTAIWSIPYVVTGLFTHPQGDAGDYVCKFLSMNNMSGLSILVSVLTLTLLAVERYCALIKAMNDKLRLTKGTVWHAVAVFWVTGTLLNMPTIIYATYDEKNLQCVYTWNKTAYAILIILFAGLSTATITFCYFKIIKELYFSKTICCQGVPQKQDLESKRRIVMLLLTLVLGFFVCYIPFVVVEFIVWSLKPRILVNVCTFLLYCSSAINPVIYAFRSSNYRQAYKKITLEFRAFICCLRIPTRWSNSSRNELETFKVTPV